MGEHQTVVTIETTLSTVFLAGCPNCHSAHPNVAEPDNLDYTCRKCGSAVPEPGRRNIFPAQLGGGLSMIAARALLAAGRFLSNLAKGPRPC